MRSAASMASAGSPLKVASVRHALCHTHHLRELQAPAILRTGLMGGDAALTTVNRRERVQHAAAGA